MVCDFIKNNLFNIMDFISEPSFKKVCEYNNRDITLPPSNNDKKIEPSPDSFLLSIDDDLL